MELTQLVFENYKCFKARQPVEVRPLTVLIGPNSSGKSVIARLPLLLGHALSNRAESPLDLAFDDLDFGGSFSDLVYDRMPHTAIKIGGTFSHGGSEFQFLAQVRYFAEVKTQLVESVEFTIDGQPALNLRWAGVDPLVDAAKYSVQPSLADRAVTFRGLLPDVQGKEIGAGAMSFLTGIRDWEDSIHYLGPFRSQPQRLYRLPQSKVEYVGHGGMRAPDLLASDVFRNKRRVLDEVASWYAEHLGGWLLDIEEEGDGFALVLVKPGNDAVRVTLMDVGTGIAQVLPMVVQRRFEAIAGKPGGLEIVEQPELHLHPQAHGDLADLYVTAVNEASTRFLIETHSEVFLLRLRRHVAEGRLDPDKVVFYWATQSPSAPTPLVPIHIDRAGEVSTWPTDVFADAYREVMAIRRVQREAGK